MSVSLVEDIGPPSDDDGDDDDDDDDDNTRMKPTCFHFHFKTFSCPPWDLFICLFIDLFIYIKYVLLCKCRIFSRILCATRQLEGNQKTPPPPTKMAGMAWLGLF